MLLLHVVFKVEVSRRVASVDYASHTAAVWLVTPIFKMFLTALTLVFSYTVVTAVMVARAYSSFPARYTGRQTVLSYRHSTYLFFTYLGYLPILVRSVLKNSDWFYGNRTISSTKGKNVTDRKRTGLCYAL